jgi:hypothetical protein
LPTDAAFYSVVYATFSVYILRTAFPTQGWTSGRMIKMREQGSVRQTSEAADLAGMENH